MCVQKILFCKGTVQIQFNEGTVLPGSQNLIEPVSFDGIKGSMMPQDCHDCLPNLEGWKK